MDLRTVDNVHNGEANILLYGLIGLDENGNGFHGRWVANDIRHLNDFPEISVINIKINSQGGSVLDALDIFNAIKDSTKPCNTYVDGVAASSAAFIAMAGKKRFMNDFARLMIHEATFNGQAGRNDKEIEALSQLNGLITSILTNNSKLSDAKISDLLKAETWFSADQAFAVGLIDEIISSERDFGEVLNELEIGADLSEVVNKLSNKLQNKVMVDLKQIAASLGLDADTAQAKIEAKVAEIVNSNATLTTENETLKNENEAFKAQIETAQNTAAEAFVDSKIEDGTFGPEQRDALVEQAKNNLEGFKAIAGSIVKKAQNIQEGLEGGLGDNTGDGLHEGKTLRELEISSPETVKQIMNNDPKKYASMYEKEYGVEYKLN